MDGVYTIKNVTKNVIINITTEGDAISTLVLVDGYNIYTTNEDSDPVKIGVAIENALTDKGYTNVSYALSDSGISAITAKLGGGTVSFKLNDTTNSHVDYVSTNRELNTAIADSTMKTIYVADGTYTTTAPVTTTLSIIGLGDDVTFDAGRPESVPTALYLKAGAKLTVKNVNFTGDDASETGIVNLYGASVELYVEDCTFANYMGVYMNPSATGYIKNSIFDVSSDTYCAIGLDTLGGAFEVSGCTFIGEGTLVGDIENWNDSSNYLTAPGATIIEKTHD